MSETSSAKLWGQRLRNLLTLPQRPKPQVGATPADVLHRENKWQLLRYRSATRTGQTPVLLVPSLINRHYVLDLQPGKSFAEFLVQRGHDVLVIDWGTPTDEDRYVSFDEVCDRWLGRAIRRTASLSPRGQCHVLGYCMGGTLAAIHAAVHPQAIASLTTLAAPVRFGGQGQGGPSQGGLLSAWTRAPGFDVGELVDALGTVPAPLLQGAFQLLRPTLPLAKAVNLVDRAWNDRYLDGYLALEAWANDNVDLPGEFYKAWVQRLYRDDALWQGTLALGGKPVALGQLQVPLQVVAFTGDAIAPADDCKALCSAAKSPDQVLRLVDGSHVGGVTSREASKTLWPELSAWWRERDGTPER
jgi:polyhydroxyalkanoate synthase